MLRDVNFSNHITNLDLLLNCNFKYLTRFPLAINLLKYCLFADLNQCDLFKNILKVPSPYWTPSNKPYSEKPEREKDQWNFKHKDREMRYLSSVCSIQGTCVEDTSSSVATNSVSRDRWCATGTVTVWTARTRGVASVCRTSFPVWAVSVSRRTCCVTTGRTVATGPMNLLVVWRWWW